MCGLLCLSELALDSQGSSCYLFDMRSLIRHHLLSGENIGEHIIPPLNALVNHAHDNCLKMKHIPTINYSCFAFKACICDFWLILLIVGSNPNVCSYHGKSSMTL